MRKKLEFQADRIDAVLAAHGIPARVEGGTVTPHWIRFQVLPAVGAKISGIRGLGEEMATALDVPSVKIARRGAAVAVEVPRDDPQPVRLLPLYRQLAEGIVPPVTAILGLAEDGAPLLIRLPSPDVAHVLVAGTTGSGKTMLLQAMILSLAMTNAPRTVAMVLIDPKGHAFGLFEGLPHLARPVIQEAEEVTEALQSLARLMERRNSPDPRIVVFIDNLENLIVADPGGVGENLTKLTLRGHEAGIHIVAATGNIDVVSVTPGFLVRLVGKVENAEDARVASGWSGTGAERLLGQGEFLAVAEGQVTRFQAAHVSPTEIREVVGSKSPLALVPTNVIEREQ